MLSSRSAVVLILSILAGLAISLPVINAACIYPRAGEAFHIETGSDNVELRESVGDVVDTITESDLSMLKSGNVTTALGSTWYNQYLRLKDTDHLQPIAVNYIANERGVMSDQLLFNMSEPILEWEIQFPTGLKSDVTESRLRDLEGKTINILGADFTITETRVEAATETINMTMLGGPVLDALREGETKKYILNGAEYEITLVLVSDSDNNTPAVMFSVNGERTGLLSQGEMTEANGTTIAVRDVLVNARESVASYYLDVKIIEFSDSFTNGQFTAPGSVKINERVIENAEVEIFARMTDEMTIQITAIKYRITADAANSSYGGIPPGHGLRELMSKPEALISDTLDLRYEGLEQLPRANFTLESADGNTYNITFTNVDGSEYTFPFVSNEGGRWKFGDASHDMVFVEGDITNPDSSVSYPIGINDYVMLSNERSSTQYAVTNIIQYTAYNPAEMTVEFTDLATWAIFTMPVVSSGVRNASGTLVIGGHSYRVEVNDSTSSTPNIFIDMNADGEYNDRAKITLTALGGAVVDPSASIYLNNGSKGSWTAAVGDGTTMTDGTTSGTNGSVTISVRAVSANFDSSTQDEISNFTISQRSGEDAALSIALDRFAGPRTDSSTILRTFQFGSSESETSLYKGMTDWGMLILLANQSPARLTLSIPITQSFAQVFVTSGIDFSCTGQDLCGNGVVDSGETCMSCPQDAGQCPGTPILACQEVVQNEAFMIETGSDSVELREAVGSVVDTITETELAILSGGRITHQTTNTSYNQYLRLKDGSNLQDTGVNFVMSVQGALGDYLIFNATAPLLEWEIQFPTGIESTIQPDGTLSGLVDMQFKIFEGNATIQKANVTGDMIHLEIARQSGTTQQTIIFQDNAGQNALDGHIFIDNELMQGAEVDIFGQYLNETTYRIVSIKYRVTPYATNGKELQYLQAGESLKERMLHPQALLSESLNIRYEGLELVQTTDFAIKARGDDRYEMTFTNIEGQKYTMPFVSNRNGVWKFGNDNDELVFVESANAQTFNIGRNDYFIVSNTRSDADKSVTNVLRYDDYDSTDTTVELRDLATGATFSVPVTGTANLAGNGSLVIGGHTYKVIVSNVSHRTPNISVDLDADTSFNGAEVGVTAWGGVVVDLAVGNITNSAGTSTSINNTIGNSRTMGSSGSSGVVSMSATVLAKNFDASPGDEVLNWTVEQAASNEVTLSFGASDYSGPSNGNDEFDRFEFTDVNGDDERQAGLTDWGIMIQEYDPSADSPSELTLKVPQRQVYARIFVTGSHALGEMCTIIAYCGDGIVGPTETCSSCPADAGQCPTSSSGTGSSSGGGGGGGGGILTTTPKPAAKPQVNNTSDNTSIAPPTVADEESLDTGLPLAESATLNISEDAEETTSEPEKSAPWLTGRFVSELVPQSPKSLLVLATVLAAALGIGLLLHKKLRR